MSYIGAEPDGMGKAQRWTYTTVGTGTVVSADDSGVPIGYTVGQVSVYLNGVKQVIPTDVVASNGSTITFTSSYASGDVVEVVALSIFSATTVEGADIISTGVTGTSKYLRVDGDGTSSWQTATDATKAPIASPTFTGVATAPSLVLTPGSAPGGGSPAEGTIYYDSTSNLVKVYNNSTWVNLTNTYQPIASGGIITIYSSGGVNYMVHTFLTSSTFTPTSSGTVDILMVAGGGGGGLVGNVSGGGGAGGVLVATGFTTTTQDYTVTVGLGGATNTNGGNTTAFGVTALGGGTGGQGDSYAATERVGFAGGSGGGGNYDYAGGAATQTSPTGFTGYGSAGGAGGPDSVWYPAGGGGGASAVGTTPATTTSEGHGGAGLANYFRDGNTSGTTAGIHIFGGGGGGALWATTNYSSGGSGGGGTGGNYNGSLAGVSGTANSGGGGGAGGVAAHPSAAGGSGIVIIRYTI